MGLIRFLLAAGVVLGHARGWGGLPDIRYSEGFILPYQAVQAFFIISGFYMSLTFPQYEGVTWKFYLNRYSRLVPSYWIVASISVALWFIFPTQDLSAAFLHGLRTASGLWGAFIGFANVTLIGSDSQFYFPEFFPPGSAWPQYWAVPQIWSVGAEIWFYLLVPLLVPAKTRTLIALIFAGTMLRFVFLALSWPFQPWQQHVFAAELPFFLIGILSHRLYLLADRRGLLSEQTGWAAFIAAVVFLSLGNKLDLFRSPTNRYGIALSSRSCCSR
jgi:peptidoglycan/LPS O-acetylase OafA/YrhL